MSAESIDRLGEPASKRELALCSSLPMKGQYENKQENIRNPASWFADNNDSALDMPGDVEYPYYS